MDLIKTKYIWVDGKLVLWDDAKVHILSHGLHYGTGIFEGIRAYWTGENLFVFRLREHINRFILSAKIYLMDIPYQLNDLVAIILQLLRKNELKKDSYIRPIAFRGLGEFGLNFLGSPVHCAIAAFPLGAYLVKGGVKVCTSSWRRIPDDSIPSTAKTCGAYVSSSLAKAEAKMRGFDEAVCFDSRGYLAEGSGENIFLVKDNYLYTPPISASILQGITRKSVIEIAESLNIAVIERDILKSELYICDEAFFTGTAAEVTPILEVDSRIIGNGKEGNLTKQISRQLSQATLGKIKKYKDWITPVY